MFVTILGLFLFVCDAEDADPHKPDIKSPLKVQLPDEPEQSKTAQKKRRNLELWVLKKKNILIRDFCVKILRNDPDFLKSGVSFKEQSYDLFIKYSILYDLFSHDLYQYKLSAALHGIELKEAMENIRPAFDLIWRKYKDEIEDWEQSQIEMTLFPEVYDEFCKQQEPKDTNIQRYFAENGDTDFPASSPDALQLLISASTESARQHAAFSRRKSLKIPLISVNGQLLDLGQK